MWHSPRKTMKYFVLAGVVGLLMACNVSTASAQAIKHSDAKPAANAADFVGNDTCTTCHADQAKSMEDNPHAKLALKHGGTGVTCEGCHGAGKAHVEGGGDVTKIINPGKLSAKDATKTCLGCHAGAHPNFERSPHAKADVSCLGCHSVHDGTPETALLKAPQPKLCFQCHTDTKASFAMPFHHKVEEGLVKCSDCHDAHGTFGNNNIKTTADQNATCTKCHTETRGPFVFEHPPAKADGCVACHTPHGSQNARLLNVPNINQLCNQCHSTVAHSTVEGQGAGSTTVQPCVSCHVKIHGSNISRTFFR